MACCEKEPDDAAIAPTENVDVRQVQPTKQKGKTETGKSTQEKSYERTASRESNSILRDIEHPRVIALTK